MPVEEPKKPNDNYHFESNIKHEESFGIYAETDLDQPTNYSLRYGEDDSDLESCDKISNNTRNEFVQDTVRTYCTEGTPYETPFFSNATSMSDLRMENGTEKCSVDNDKPTTETKSSKMFNLSHLDEKDHCSVEDISEIEVKPAKEENFKSEFNSGIMSPEKPVNYCEEGTPGYFSRRSSLGSLNSLAMGELKENFSNASPRSETNAGKEIKAFSTPNDSEYISFSITYIYIVLFT